MNENESEHKDHIELMRIMRENTELQKANNVLLKKIHRHFVVGIIFKFVWFAILIGLPFAIYFYFLQPYFEALGANFDVFRIGMGEIPGIKGFEKLMKILAE